MKLTRLLVKLGLWHEAPEAPSEARPGADASGGKKASGQASASAEKEASDAPAQASEAKKKSPAAKNAGGSQPKAPAAEKEGPREPPPTRVVSLNDLQERRRAAEREAQAGSMAARLGLEATPEQIYQAAGIAGPSHGWTLEKLAEKLGSGAKVEDAALVLAEHRVPLEDLLRDGAAKDHALDRYEEHLDARLAEFRVTVADRAEELREQARQLSREAEVLEEGLKVALQRMEDWRKAKHATEDELEKWAALLAPLAAGPAAAQVDVAGEASAARGGSPVTGEATAGAPAAAEREVAEPTVHPAKKETAPIKSPPEAEASPWAPPAPAHPEEPHRARHPEVHPPSPWAPPTVKEDS